MSMYEIAKRIRADIKTAQREGLLPDHWQYSVRYRSFSGGTAIDVEVKNCADAWMPCPGYKVGSKHEWPDGSWTATRCGNPWCKAGGIHKDLPAAEYHEVLTEEALAAQMTLERIHDAFNHDGSDVMTDYFDVNYHGTVDFQTAWGAEFEAKEKARKAARK